jgi:hypothetical protein
MVESAKGPWIRYSEYERDMAAIKEILDHLPQSHIELAIFFSRMGFPPAPRKNIVLPGDAG